VTLHLEVIEDFPALKVPKYCPTAVLLVEVSLRKSEDLGTVKGKRLRR
jgi:hypothetical protein